MKLHQRSISGTAEQELLMREVLEELEEVATMLTYDPWPGDFEIIAIYPHEWEETTVKEKTVVRSAVTASLNKCDNVISYQKYKELHLQLSA